MLKAEKIINIYEMSIPDRVVNPELTPMDLEALACSNTGETAMDEVGISECPEMNT